MGGPDPVTPSTRVPSPREIAGCRARPMGPGRSVLCQASSQHRPFGGGLSSVEAVVEAGRFRVAVRPRLQPQVALPLASVMVMWPIVVSALAPCQWRSPALT